MAMRSYKGGELQELLNQWAAQMEGELRRWLESELQRPDFRIGDAGLG